MADSTIRDEPPSRDDQPRDVKRTLWLIIGLLATVALGVLSWTTVVPNALDRVESDEEVLQSTLTTLSGLKEASSALSQASTELETRMTALQSAIDAIADPNAKSTLQREFGPASEAAQRINAIARGMSGAYQRFGSVPQAHPRYSARMDLLNAIVSEANALQQRNKGKGRPQGGASTNLRTMYEATVQQQQKIKFFEHTFYILGGLGAFVILAAVFGPTATRTTFVEIAKIYIPSLLSSWGTFMAAVSI